MKLNILLLAALCASPTLVNGQRDTLVERYLNTITRQELQGHLEVLASDAYEGRETGFKGQKMAAEYLRKAFASMSIGPVPDWEQRGLLAPGYEQPFAVELSKPGTLKLEVNGARQGFMESYFYFSERTEKDLVFSEVVFMGFGENTPTRNDYVDLDVKGKVVLVVEGEGGRAAKAAEPDNAFFSGLTRKTAAATAAGARVVLYASPNADAMMTEFGHYLTSSRMTLKGQVKDEEAPQNATQVIIIDQELAERILQKGGIHWKKLTKACRRPGKAIPSALALRYLPEAQQLQAENVLGYVEGTDLKDQLVIVTAHYDHIGKDGDEVYNGADDDGSGTVALLEMAQAFAQARKEGHGPRRSLLFMPVSGEEKGLLGSEYYSDHPVFPLESTVVDLNIDMIGRTDSAHRDSKPYVYVIGSDRLSSDLHRINEEANTAYVGLELDYTFNGANDPNRFYYRSDHYNFARKGVPVIFYFSGVHADYHQPTDEVDRIRFDLLEQRTRLVFATAWELANRSERIAVDKAVEKGE